MLNSSEQPGGSLGDEPKLVLVEGKDEIRVFAALAQHMQKDGFQFLDYSERGKLKDVLDVIGRMAKFQEIESLGIVADADTASDSARQKIQDALRGAGLPVPKEPLTIGLQEHLRVSFIILPHGRDHGMLEDVCLESVEADAAMQCVAGFFDCIGHTDVQGPRNMAKARVHAFLASRERPDLRLGEAAQRGIWLFDHAAFTPLRNFLEIL